MASLRKSEKDAEVSCEDSAFAVKEVFSVALSRDIPHILSVKYLVCLVL